ncbi:hypothetical protein D3C87_1567410 [compost metagenome]
MIAFFGRLLREIGADMSTNPANISIVAGDRRDRVAVRVGEILQSVEVKLGGNSRPAFARQETAVVPLHHPPLGSADAENDDSAVDYRGTVGRSLFDTVRHQENGTRAPIRLEQIVGEVQCRNGVLAGLWHDTGS